MELRTVYAFSWSLVPHIQPLLDINFECIISVQGQGVRGVMRLRATSRLRAGRLLPCQYQFKYQYLASPLHVSGWFAVKIV